MVIDFIFASSVCSLFCHMDEQFLTCSEAVNQSEGKTVCIFSLCMRVNDQYVVQKPFVRTSKREDTIIWYDKTSGEPALIPTPIT